MKHRVSEVTAANAFEGEILGVENLNHISL